MTPIPSVEEEIRMKRYQSVRAEMDRRFEVMQHDEEYERKIQAMTMEELGAERDRLMRGEV